MSQVIAAFSRTFKEFIREKAALFWTLVWPIIWVIIGSTSMTASAPPEVRPYINAA